MIAPLSICEIASVRTFWQKDTALSTESNQFSLLGQRRFAPFFLTQFLGALNDNVFRNGLIILVTFQGILVLGMDKSQLANVASLLFILPFFLFSATAGQFADKYEKSMLIRRIKLFEIALMILAATALLTRSYPLLLVILFLMGCQSTLFGPVKYAYLPQQLETSELVGGNALIEAGTYVAIILGLILGGLAVAITPRRLDVAGSSHCQLCRVRIPDQSQRSKHAGRRPGAENQLERLARGRGA